MGRLRQFILRLWQRMKIVSQNSFLVTTLSNKVKNGMTREEVIKIMNCPPTRVSNQGKVFVWSYAKVNLLKGTESSVVKFSFDDAGKTYGVPEGGVYGDTDKYIK